MKNLQTGIINSRYDNNRRELSKNIASQNIGRKIVYEYDEDF